jgi:hypothetical protein
MFLVNRYSLTEKQKYDFQQWRKKEEKKYEEERRKKFLIIPFSESDMWKKEQDYLNKWIEEQKEKGEVFKLKKGYRK